MSPAKWRPFFATSICQGPTGARYMWSSPLVHRVSSSRKAERCPPAVIRRRSPDIALIPQCTSPMIMHHFATKICTYLLQNAVLWDICLMHCGICDIGGSHWKRFRWFVRNKTGQFLVKRKRSPEFAGHFKCCRTSDRNWEITNGPKDVWNKFEVSSVSADGQAPLGAYRPADTVPGAAVRVN